MDTWDTDDDSKGSVKQELIKMYEQSRKRRRSCNQESAQKDDPSLTLNIKKEKTEYQQNLQDKMELYGLKLEYLKSLNITPPLSSWVLVKNFRCEKSELRDILELAGHVLVCSVNHTREKHAMVMYSHPLEAVQAISMLNKQIFYGQPLNLQMCVSSNDSIILPKGLKNLGPGLGIRKEPLRDVVKEYENFRSKNKSKIDPYIFERDIRRDNDWYKNDEQRSGDNGSDWEVTDEVNNTESIKQTHLSVEYFFDSSDNDSDTGNIKSTVNQALKDKPSYSPSSNRPDSTGSYSMELSNKIQVSNNRSNSSSVNERPIPSVGSTRTNAPNNLSSMQGPSGQNIRGQWSNNIRPTPNYIPVSAAPICSGNIGPRPMNPMNGPIGTVGPRLSTPNAGNVNNFGPNVPMAPMNAITPNLEFRNLPPSTTFPILCNKMSECGQVLSIQMTTPGCAIVKYSHPSHAERCFQMYNRRCVAGCLVEARFI